MMVWPVSESRLAVGSSQIRNRGYRPARASATRCCIPPLSSRGRRRSAAEPDLVEHPPGPPLRLASRDPAYQQSDGDVFEDGDRRDQVVLLEHHAHQRGTPTASGPCSRYAQRLPKISISPRSG